MCSDIVPESYIKTINRRLKNSGYSLSENVEVAFKITPRSYFVLDQDKHRAYTDKPLSIPAGQTISAPHMYALMLSKELGDPQPNMTILEIGTGSGYGAALLANSVPNGRVISIERHHKLVKFASENLKKLDIDNVEILHANGVKDIPQLMYDRIIVTAAGKTFPEIYLKHLHREGRIVIPLENQNREQWIWLIHKDKDNNVKQEKIMQVLFVPLVD